MNFEHTVEQRVSRRSSPRAKSFSHEDNEDDPGVPRFSKDIGKFTGWP